MAMPSNENTCPKVTNCPQCGVNFCGTAGGWACLQRQIAKPKRELAAALTELTTLKAQLAALREAYGWATSDNADDDQEEEGWVKFHSLLSTAPEALAVVDGGAFDGQIDHLENWPWKDGHFRLYPSTEIDDQIDGGKIDLQPITVVVLPRSGGK